MALRPRSLPSKPFAGRDRDLDIRWFFSRRWLFTSLLVIAAAALMIRLGIWQLDRLERRRAFNTRVSTQVAQPPLELAGGNLSADLVNQEYRQVVVVGEYDPANQVVLRNQAWRDQPGVHLLTPLRIAGSDQSVLVDRGWIPLSNADPANWEKYAQPGVVEVRGVIRRSQSAPEIGWRKDLLPAPGEGRLENWYMVNVAGIASQVPYSLLPVYVQQAPDTPRPTSLESFSTDSVSVGQSVGSNQEIASQLQAPLPAWSKLDLSEGSHLGYALQWFTFAAILVFGYPFYIRKEKQRMMR